MGYFLLVCRKKKLYLRIGEGGSPIVCGKNEAKVFDDIKAQNVLDHLPKVLQKMNFVKEPVVQSELNISDEEEIPSEKTVIVKKTVVKNTSCNKKAKKIIKNTSYKVIKFIYNNIMYAEINTKNCYCEKCGFDGDIPLVEDEDGILKWKCPNCGNTDNTTMDIAFRVCGYIGTAKNGGNQGRYGDIHDRVYHLDDTEYEE